MRYFLRVLGWLLLGMGCVLSLLGVLALSGLAQVPIDFFGVEVGTGTGLVLWTGGWLVAAAAGLALLRATIPHPGCARRGGARSRPPG